jgi:hypothetical protein
MIMHIYINTPLLLGQTLGPPLRERNVAWEIRNNIFLSAHEGYLVTDFVAYRLPGNVKRRANLVRRIKKKIIQ